MERMDLTASESYQNIMDAEISALKIHVNDESGSLLLSSNQNWSSQIHESNSDMVSSQTNSDTDKSCNLIIEFPTGSIPQNIKSLECKTSSAVNL